MCHKTSKHWVALGEIFRDIKPKRYCNKIKESKVNGVCVSACMRTNVM